MSQFNLKQLADFLINKNLMEKRFCDMSQTEINDFCEQVHLATEVVSGYTPPYVNERGELVIPHDVPPKYRWWAGGQSIKETLEEIGAPDETMCWCLDQKKGGRKV